MRRTTPLWRLFTVAAGAGALVPAVGPVADFDVYWHVRLGDLILRTRSLPTHEPWLFTAQGRRWLPHSWLSDVVLALAHRAGGWGGVVALRLLLGAALVALAARAVIKGNDAVVGPVVAGVAALALAPQVQERPQTFALVLLAALLPLLDRARGGAPPPPLVWAAAGWLWASLHGSWALLPVLLALAAVGNRRDAVRRLLLGALAAVAGAALTPVGPALLLRPFLVGREAGRIAEWQPAELWGPQVAMFTLLIAALAVAWARSPAPVPVAELLWCAVPVAAALAAVRNVGFAVLLVAPVVARRLSDVVPPGRRSTVPAWSVPAFAAVAALGLVALALPEPRLPTDAPVALVETLRAQPGEVRVLNDFNVGGFLTGHGVPAAIDGRIDALPPGFAARYGAAMELDGDWAGLIAELRPTHALLDKRLPLTYVLESERGWRRLGDNEVYVLLEAP